MFAIRLNRFDTITEYSRMHSQSIRILGWIVFFVIATVPSFGFADDWTWGPFSKSTSSRDSSPLYSKSSSKSSWLPSMKMPTMPWSSKGPRVSSYSRSNTSYMGRMNKATKNAWSKTAEWLDPYPDPKPSTYSSGSESQKSNSNWLTGWFTRKEPYKPMTENDFLRQDKPGL